MAFSPSGRPVARDDSSSAIPLIHSPIHIKLPVPDKPLFSQRMSPQDALRSGGAGIRGQPGPLGPHSPPMAPSARSCHPIGAWGSHSPAWADYPMTPNGRRQNVRRGHADVLAVGISQ
jgi:hypothetical protein